MSQKLVQTIAELNEDQAIRLTQQLLDDGVDPTSLLDDCRQAMEIVGKNFEKGDYFLPELIMAGEILKQISELVKPRMQNAHEVKRRGKVLVGTVKGDIHDIGKDLVVFMLDANGFQVYDLGIDVPARTFVEKINEVQPEVVALSGFLTVAFDSMKRTVEAIKAAGLRDQVKIMVGGGTVDAHACAYAGADAYGTDAMVAVTLAKQWTETS